MSCANAGKHSGRSEGIRKLMPALGESAAEFDQVRDGLYQALRPSDAFEEMLVDAMVDIQWRLARIIPRPAASIWMATNDDLRTTNLQTNHDPRTRYNRISSIADRK
jgi:hypothetical protein